MNFDFGLAHIDVKQLLGKTDVELSAIIGLPDSELIYSQDGVCKKYSYGAETVIVEFSDGLVRKIGPVNDRRESIRVVPLGIKNAYIRVDDGALLRGHIINMSAKSILFKLGNNFSMPIKDAKIRFCTSIEVKRFSQTYISLRGSVHHMRDNGHIVVMLDKDMPTLSYNELVRHIERNIAMKVLSDSVVTTYRTENSIEINITLSDQCFDCPDKFCGIRQ